MCEGVWVKCRGLGCVGVDAFGVAVCVGEVGVCLCVCGWDMRSVCLFEGWGVLTSKYNNDQMFHNGDPATGKLTL